jgi:hypothetical protein
MRNPRDPAASRSMSPHGLLGRALGADGRRERVPGRRAGRRASSPSPGQDQRSPAPGSRAREDGEQVFGAGIGGVAPEDAADAALELVERDGLAGLVEHEADGELRVEGPDEEVPRLGDLDVLAEADAERERVAVEVRQQAGEGAARGLGLERRPLAGEAHDLGGEGPRGSRGRRWGARRAAGRRRRPRRGARGRRRRGPAGGPCRRR